MNRREFMVSAASAIPGIAAPAEPAPAAVFSASKERIEIPWWNFRTSDSSPWEKVFNLAGRGGGRVYAGEGVFECEFFLPETARGEEIFAVLGGYDQQDWNERWVSVNGVEAGRQSQSGRWRTPGEFRIPAAALRFGGNNRLRVRCRGYDFHFGGISEKAFQNYVFRPYLFDQFISVGPPYARNPEGIRVTVRSEREGAIRRKWLEIANLTGREQLLLDVVLDDFRFDGPVSEGGYGEPVFLGDDGFCAVEHPSGINQGQNGRVKLWHCPGRKLAPGATFRSAASIFGTGAKGRALEAFHEYLTQRSPRRTKKRVSIYTGFGLNNQWGACPTLSDAETLDVHQVLREWQAKGVKFDFYTIDSGWPDNSGDLKDFAPTCYPDGPAGIVASTAALDMKLGLWFSTSWGGWSCGSNPAVQASAIPEPGSPGTPPADVPVGTYRNGYPVSGGIGRQLCMASEPYFRVFRDAVVHHIRNNQVRLVKFDSGNYYCNSTAHQHLPGKYSVEAMHNRLIEIARASREAAPDTFVVWYWGVGSPFWALHGDVIFESGLFMEGSGTSWYPALYYRDSVTLSLDQNTQFARLIPPRNKDSLGVWLSQIRWGNFMGRERWREALVMDLGRGNLLFPQIWGDPYLLQDDDLRFLAEIMALARQNEAILLQPRRNIGDAWRNEPYGYAYSGGGREFYFLNNMHFEPRPVRLPGGEKVAHFPEKARISGEELWLRPFEVAVVEIRPRVEERLPDRPALWPGYGSAVALSPAAQAPWMDLRFADAARFEKAGLRKRVRCYAGKLPEFGGGRHILAIPVRLRRGGEDYKYRPVVAEIVQLRVRVGGLDRQMIPVPDARQFGNTQSAGCSWVLYKLPLPAGQSGKAVEFAVHSYLPEGVDAPAEAWVVKQWWNESARPQADGFYGDAPS